MISKEINNIIWNFSGGIISGLALVFATPLYVDLLGVESFGILSIWLILQVLMGFLDFGIGPTIIKELANIEKTKEVKPLVLIKTAEVLIVFISFFFFIVFYFNSNWLSLNWFKSTFLDKNYLSNVIKYMSLALAFQFPTNLYISILNGLQDHRRMNLILISSNLLKYILGFTTLFIYRDLESFFITQAFIALFITLLCRQISLNRLKRIVVEKVLINFKIFLPNWRFSLGMAFTSFVAVFLSNVDRLILSKVVSTEDLGKYAIAFTATGILQLAIQPFYKAYFPRFAELVNANNENEIEKEYFQSSRIMSAIIISISTLSIVFASDLFNIWIGFSDPQIVLVFRILIFSITCSGLMWLPIALQQAYNWTSLHLFLMLFALSLGIPISIFYAMQLGIVGGTIIWVIHGVSEITLGLWLMHKKILVGKLKKWYFENILPPLFISIVISLSSYFFIPNSDIKFFILLKILFTGLFIIISILFYFIKKKIILLNGYYKFTKI